MPSQHASRQSAIEAVAYQLAVCHWPARASSTVCKLKAEKVVKPPQSPTVTKTRISGGTSNRGTSTVSVPKQPMTKDPSTLISSVPQGNAIPQIAVAAVFSQ